MSRERLGWFLIVLLLAGISVSAAGSSLVPLRSIPGRPSIFGATNLIPGRIYEIQKSEDLRTTNWANAGFLWSDGLENRWRDPADSTQAFYRLKQTSRQVFESRVHLDNYLVYYGFWDQSTVAGLLRYDLVVLNPNNGPADVSVQKALVKKIKAGTDGVPGTKDDVLVLGYVSMGEDQRTFNHAPADRGDGTGPCYFDRNLGRVVYENNGYASYYMDEWDTDGPPGGHALEHDGLPDRNGDWGACYVNAGDPKWQEIVIGSGRLDRPFGFDAIAQAIAFDGFFLDTPEVASPWERFGWTSKGIHDLIATTRQLYPEKIFLLNRGLFFFMPHYPEQYHWSPRRYIDLLLYESYYLDSAYSTGLDYNLNSYFNLNRYYVSPKVNAEMGRPDSIAAILSIDYSRYPSLLPNQYPGVYSDCLAESVVNQGRIEMITDRDVLNLDNPLLDMPAPADTKAPLWDNTSSGFIEDEINPDAMYFEARGMESAKPTMPRVGVQKAVPESRAVTVLWDAAKDQTRRIKYNLYYSEKPFVDFNQASCLADVAATMPNNYTNRSYLGADDQCPYEYTVGGLSNNVTYFFAVRAEDSTMGVVSPTGGRIGPGGGIEETNQWLLAAAPRQGGVSITIDGRFDDWTNVPAFPDQTGDARGGEVDWVKCKVTDNLDFIYFYLQCASNMILSDRHVLYLNTDQISSTGYMKQKGADFVFMGGKIFRYSGTGEDWSWDYIETVAYAIDRDQMEIGIPKASIRATTIGGGLNFFLYGDNSNGVIDYMPDAGSSGYSYTYILSPLDSAAPDFDIESFAASDAAVDGVVLLRWAEGQDPNGPVSYEVLQDNVLTASTRQTQFVLSGLSNGVEHAFAVRAKDKLGNAVLSVPRRAAATKDALPPVWGGAPGVQKVVARDGLATLYWHKANDQHHPPARFNVYYDVDDIASYATANKIKHISLSVSDDSNYSWMWQIAGLQNNRRYCFSVRCEDRAGNEDANTNRITVVVQAPSRLGTNTMDGAFGDWENDPNVVSCGLDSVGDGAPGDLGGDIAQTWLANNADSLFVRWRLNGEVAPSKFEYIVFLDTDQNPATGYPTDWNAVGADYMAINGSLYRYTGIGGQWSWALITDKLGFSPGVAEKNCIELAIPREAIGAAGVTRKISVWFYVGDRSNETVDDVFPNYGSAAFVYPF